MTDPARQGIACAGNWILDILHDLPYWPQKSDLVRISARRTGLGGGPANVAADLAAMGAAYPILPVGLIGTDAAGDEVLAHCRTAGLPVDRIARTTEAATSQTFVMNIPGDSRTFFYHPGASDLLGADHINVADLADLGPRLFYLGYLNLLATLDTVGADGRSAAASVLAEARARGMVTCVDLVSSQGDSYRRTVAGSLPEIDVLFLNEVEAQRATGLRIAGPIDTEGMTAAARALAEGGVRRAVILHSAERTGLAWRGARPMSTCPTPSRPSASPAP